jgi:Ca2+:H+ antiporter
MLMVLSLGTASPYLLAIAIGFLGVSVITAVHHAEVIALRVGPSLGALILALSVTVIEVGLIVSLMTNDSPESSVVARDTIFAAVIIVTNGIVGVSLLLGGLRFRELDFHVQ